MTGFYWANVVEPDTYAQPADLAAYMMIAVDALPANAALILRRTTKQVLTATQGAFYQADPATGLPLPEVADDGSQTTETLDALVEANCIQAGAWITLGIDPLAGGVYVPSVKASTKIGSASVQRAQGDQDAAVAARAAALTGLVPAAVEVLQHHNLIGNGPWTFG